MAEEATLEALTEEQIFEYLTKKPNIRTRKFMSLDNLEMNFENEGDSLRPYVHIIDTEKRGLPINPKLPTPRLEIHLAYSLNPINSILIERVFCENGDVKVIFPIKIGNSTYASREIRELEDVDDILDLATRYHEIVDSDGYSKASKCYKIGINVLANELVERLIKI